MLRLARLALTVVALVTGPISLAPGPIAAPSARAIPVFYDADLTAAGFPSPLMRARVGNVDALFIIDTGAGVHTLAAWFVAAAGLSSAKSSSTAHGATGAEFPVRITSNVSIALSDATTLDLKEAAVVDFPPIFQKDHLAGLISPQLLASAGEAAVLDFRTPALSIAPLDPAQELVGRRAPQPDDTRSCHNGQSAFSNLLYAGAVTLDGHRSMMLVDSGATVTTLNRDASVATWFADRSRPGASEQGLGGAVQSMRQVRDVQVERGGSTVTLSIGVGSASGTCGPDGLLGMDALRGCSMVLSASTMAWSCAAAK